ncbi:helix-turn-helix transcriptional regulator [Dietzia maris]|uniref:helix-turn-helix domain-containing protein n=1 Tax=Dietzia maris TaxID=37915 RepID=UPI003426059D
MATFAARARAVTDIATSVRDARLAAGMSQADLAAAAHLNRSWVSLFESGHTPNASLSKVLAMMDVLGITIRLSYTVPDSIPHVLESARRPRRTTEESEMVEAPADDGEALTAARPTPLDEAALAAARAIRESHRARAIADDLDRRSSNA